MAKYKADFFSWDDDLDLDEILGDYTADESENDICSKAIDSNAYQCPECKKEYKRISGFRGYVLKKHEKNLREVQIDSSDNGKKIRLTEDEIGAQSKKQDPSFKDEESTDGAENPTGVMVITPLPSQATVDFFGKLEERLRGACQICLTEMDVNTFNKEDKEGNLVMVICNNHGRINSDVKNALKEINECLYQRMFVIILHCKKEKHLSTEPLCGKLKADFPDVQHFVEMAFDQDLPEGIFDCEMNNNALEDIAQRKNAFAQSY